MDILTPLARRTATFHLTTRHPTEFIDLTDRLERLDGSVCSLWSWTARASGRFRRFFSGRPHERAKG